MQTWMHRAGGARNYEIVELEPMLEAYSVKPSSSERVYVVGLLTLLQLYDVLTAGSIYAVNDQIHHLGHRSRLSRVRS